MPDCLSGDWSSNLQFDVFLFIIKKMKNLKFQAFRSFINHNIIFLALIIIIFVLLLLLINSFIKEKEKQKEIDKEKEIKIEEKV